MLLGETTSGSYKTAHYKHRYPIASYLVAFAVTNYSTFSTSVQLGQKTLPLVYYVYPEDLSYFMANTQPVINAIKLYNTSFGKYPFINEKYGQTQFSWGGGMELACQSILTVLMNFGFLVFGVTDYSGKKMTLHYGAVASKAPREEETQEACRILGRRLAEWTALYVHGRKDQNPLTKNIKRLCPSDFVEDKPTPP